jgi:hypothetical protein
MAAAVPTTTGRTWRYWNQGGWWGDQGARPWCVDYAWHHWTADGPVTHGRGQRWTPGDVYRHAQLIDEWPGQDYDGTSVRAGAKVLQHRGYITEYRWAWDADTVARALLEVGPVVVGTWWTTGMSEPDAEGIIHYTGSRQGGHAYLLNGVNVARGLARVKNSWGRQWSRNGTAWLPLDDLDRLVTDDGEACLAVERSTR